MGVEITNIAIIDADLVGRKQHRFPNLACMKISSYYKSKGHTIMLKMDYKALETFDKVFISKVFTDTPIDANVLNLDNVEHGGTGFYYDKAKPLPYEIEHHMPDYNLYNNWVNEMLGKDVKPNDLEYYTSYSIGFTTRGCFRKCPFCVNQKYNKVEIHSPINEFLDTSRKYICLLDDNILGYQGWKDIINQLKLTNKHFQYKQGMDERLMTKEKAELLSNCKYKGDYIFAFDNIEDKEVIKAKLGIWKIYCKKTTKLYVLCGFDKADKYDQEFWKQDIIDTFERIKILMEYGCIPYIMRFNRYEESPYRGTYINLGRWCNQPNFFKKKSYREFCIANGENSATVRYANEFERDFPEIAAKYYDLKYEQLNKYPKEVKQAI